MSMDFSDDRAPSSRLDTDRDGADRIEEQWLAETEQVRRGRTIVLGVLLLLGFFLPIVVHGFGKTEILFLNLTLLKAIGDTPFWATFVAVFPLVAGLVLIATASSASSRCRATTTVCLGSLFMIFLLFSGSGSPVGGLGRYGKLLGDCLSRSILGGVGLLVLFVGFRVLYYRPRRSVGAAMAICGAAAAGLARLLPTEVGSGLLGQRQIPVVLPFELLFKGHGFMRYIGVVGLVGLALVAACIAMAVVVFLRREDDSPMAQQDRARIGTILVISSVFVPVLLTVTGVLVQGGGQGGALVRVLPMLTSAVVKTALWIGASMLVLPFGCIDLLVELVSPELGPLPTLSPEPVSPAAPGSAFPGDRLGEP